MRPTFPGLARCCRATTRQDVWPVAKVLVLTAEMGFFSRIASPRWFFRLSGLLVLLTAAGCSASTDRMSTLDPKGPLAQMQLDLFMVTVYVCTVIFILVGAALAFVVWRFRAQGPADHTVPKQSHGNPLVEMGLIALSVIALVFIAVPTVKGIWYMHEMPEGSEEAAIEINVRGYQWWWSFDYPEEGITTANELVIPEDTVIKLNLRTNDVIHSFWLPKIAGKVDLMPGRRNWMWIKADEPGHYYGQCAEYCGDAHAYMLFRADVLPQDEYDAWVAEKSQGARAPDGSDDWSGWMQQASAGGGFPEDDIQEGARLFFTKGGCIQCHAIDGSIAMGILGPNLTHVGSRSSLAAGILENRGENGEIDPAKQLENLDWWIRESYRLKPGNLMYEQVRQTWDEEAMALLQEGDLNSIERRKLRTYGMLAAELDAISAEPMTREEIESAQSARLTDGEIHKIARFLQSLK